MLERSNTYGEKVKYVDITHMAYYTFFYSEFHFTWLL